MTARLLKRQVMAVVLALALGAPGAAEATGPGGWESLGGGLADTASAVSSDLPGQVLVGGRDLNAGGNVNADHLAGWNGSSWIQYGAATDLGSASQSVHAIAVANNKIYVGGSFKVANGALADSLAVWDLGAPSPSWQPFCATTLSGSAVIDALEVVGNTLYVGGAFDNANGNPLADNMVACDLGNGALTAVVDDNGDLAGGVQALAADSNGHVYVGGTFTGVNSDDQPGNATTTNYVVKYTGGTNWVPMPDGMGNSALDTANVDALATSGTDVYVGADDTDIANLPAADHVAKWNGSSWSAVGSAYFPEPAAGAQINGLLATGGQVYATGDWADAAADATGDDVAVFNASAWGPMGSRGSPPAQGPLGLNSEGVGEALAVLNGTPIVAGNFTNAGGDALADRVACFGSCPSPAIVPPNPPASPPPTTTTGKRAAARKKCKKKRTAKARKKCRKKANKLPV